MGLTFHQHIRYLFGYKTEFLFLPKQLQKFRFVLSDGSRSSGLFRKGKTCMIAKFHRTVLVIFIVMLEKGGTPSYS